MLKISSQYYKTICGRCLIEEEDISEWLSPYNTGVKSTWFYEVQKAGIFIYFKHTECVKFIHHRCMPNWEPYTDDLDNIFEKYLLNDLKDEEWLELLFGENPRLRQLAAKRALA